MTVTLVQGPLETTVNTSGTTVSKAFTSNVTAGNTIIVVARAIDLSAPSQASTYALSASDSLGNTYTSAVQTPAVTDDTETIAILYAKNITGGACTVTATFSLVADKSAIMIYEVSGLDGTTPLEATNSAGGTSTTPSAGNVTSAAGGFLIAAAVNQNNYNAISAGSGWTADSPTAQRNAVKYERRIEAAGGTFTGNFTQGSSGNWSAIVAAFKSGSAPTVKTVSLTLRDLTGALLPNLANLHVAIWKTTNLSTLAAAPDYKSSTAATDSSAVMNVNVNSVAAFSVGDTVLVALTNVLGSKTLLAWTTVVSG